jgi:2-polyprenyl-3-methyl-5-hydroxy-6-metoxy-1,4-benzoquinol methylase
MSDVCPICCSFEKSFLYKLSVEDIITEIAQDGDLRREQLLRKIVTNLWGQNHASFYQCKECKYGYVQPYISGNAEYYTHLYYHHFNYPKEKWEFDMTLSSILSKPDFNKFYVLEIGAGNGAFLEKIHNNGVKKERIYSSEYSKAACQEIILKGFQSTDLPFSEFVKNFPNLKFDTICMFQVLEHMDNIEELFTFLNQISHKDTFLYIAVPNALLREFLDIHGIHYDIAPTHVGKLPIETFRFLCQKFEWEINEYDYQPAKYFSKFRKFIFERYFKNRNAKKIEKINNVLLKHMVRYFYLMKIIIKYFAIIKNLRNNKYGTSFWIELKKI